MRLKGPLQLDLFEPRDHEYEYKVLITNKPVGAAAAMLFHNGRGNQEAILPNQARILANQEKIVGNQARLYELLANQRTILANQAVALIVQPSGSGAVNSGTMRAAAGGTLTLLNGSFNNASGLIESVSAPE